MGGPSGNNPWLDRIVITLALSFGLWWLQNLWRQSEEIEDQLSNMNRAIGQIETRNIEIERRMAVMDRLREDLVRRRVESWDSKTDPPPEKLGVPGQSRGVIQWNDWIDE
jgi:hypothetical protein